MIHLFRLARSHPKASAANIQNCASIPSSGFNFNDKSQGASAATAELADALGGALNQIDVVGNYDAPSKPNIRQLPSACSDPGDPINRLRKLFHDLDHETSQYANYKISDVALRNINGNAPKPSSV